MLDLQSLPNEPGCYLFKNDSGKVIYVGKANNLKKRVSSYFSKKHEVERTNILVKNISGIEFFVVDNEVEAFLLENNLIKKYKPKYNINLKDSKRYAFIQRTDEEYPRFLVARKREGKGKFYGPFVSGTQRDNILEAIIKIFKIRTCKRLPKKECIRFAIGLCSAPCIKKIDKQDYLNSVKSSEMVLKGKTKWLNKILFTRMKESSNRQDFERALEYKNQIVSLKSLDEKQKMERQKNYDEDIINYIVLKNTVHLMMFNSKKGILENKQEFEFDYGEDFLDEFLIRYYSENKIPKEIILPVEPSFKIGEYLSNIKNKKVSLVSPKSGEKKEFLDLVKKNLEISLFGDEEKVLDLMNSLKLNEEPRVIECFDISHLSGTSTVASMVQFRNAKPDKTNYRRFKIRSVEGIDDYASMKEVIRRRYTKLKRENLPYPDLIIIDGGKGQLSSALEVLEEIEVKIPIISIAKREEEIFEPGRISPIILDKKENALKLIQAIRDEAHRFAISYNRLLRSKKIRSA